MTPEQVKDGMKVQWQRRNGDMAKGIVVGAPVQMEKGAFVTVEAVDEKGKRTGKTNKVRPSQLSKR